MKTKYANLYWDNEGQDLFVGIVCDSIEDTEVNRALGYHNLTFLKVIKCEVPTELVTNTGNT